jgi:hypothetical protein
MTSVIRGGHVPTPELWTFELKFHCFRPDARPAELASRRETEIGRDALSR